MKLSHVVECGYCGKNLAVRKDTHLGWDRIRCSCGAEFNWLSSAEAWNIFGVHDPPRKKKKDV